MTIECMIANCKVGLLPSTNALAAALKAALKLWNALQELGLTLEKLEKIK